MKKLSEAEQKLVNWIKSFGNLSLFTKNNQTYYRGILKNFPYLLDKAFPSRLKKNPKGKKQELLELARSGAKKPKTISKLYRCIISYTGPKSKMYDPKFTKQIKAIRPDWFNKDPNNPSAKKQELLDLAKSGADKPLSGTKMRNYIGIYTTKSQVCYDPEFTKKIKAIRPDWFISKSHTRKQELLELARSGAKKPTKRTTIGLALIRYINKRCYDPEFTKQIKTLRPDWFKS
jgi:hypothetical protein